MKIRTKLAIALCAALVVTTVASTWLQVRWTRRDLEAQAQEQLTYAAVETVRDLETHLAEDFDSDDISDRLDIAVRRHRVAGMEFTFDSDEDTTVSVNLGVSDEEAKVRSTARPPKRRPALRRDEIRRALTDHGSTSRPPGERAIEPLWRTPDRSESAGWGRLSAHAPPAKRPPKAPIVVTPQGEHSKDARLLEWTLPVELPGSRHGQLVTRLSLETIDRLASEQVRISAAVTGTALLLLMVFAAFFGNRILVRPIEALVHAMRGVEGGDLSRRVDAPGADEIGKLGRGFNAMLSRLALADGEIRAFNRRLADEVTAATTDLARKNEALAHLNKLLIETRRELGDKERLAALGQLAAQLAHEIGTPLASVSGHLQLAMSAREAQPALRERLLKAARELERISKIVRDYLDSTRPIKPARVDCDLGRLIDDAIGIALGAGERPGVRVERVVSPEAAAVETAPGLLRQILINLVTNAIDAVAAQKRPGEVVVETALEGGMVELRVRDDGVGIPPDDAARIFEPFYTTKGRGKGTGLGLAICRELASALGGRIGVESVPGAGSTFTVRLPAGRTPASPSAQPPMQWHPSGRVG